MFTGLVETTGTIAAIIKKGNGVRLSIKPLSEIEIHIGDSITVNGVCLTVTEHSADLQFDVSPETLKSTNIGDLKVQDKVNLERALRLSDRLGGHIVTGHVDGTGIITERLQQGEYTFYSIESTNDILKYIVQKGSIAVDGISLTVVECNEKSFRVAIIPHTLTATNIGEKNDGDKVNLETDIIGKYIEKFTAKIRPDSGFKDMLREKGFLHD